MTSSSSFQILWNAVRLEKKAIAVLLLVDFSFFVLFALLHTFIVVQALPDLAAITQLVAKESRNVPQVPPDAADIDPSQLRFSFPVGEFQERFTRVMGYAALYIAVMFILYNLVYGFTWLKTSILLKRKPIPYHRYLLRFAGVNIFWLLVFIGGFYLYILLSSATMFGQIALVSQGVVDVIGIILAIIVLYLVMVSHALLIDYPVLPLLKRTAIVGIKRAVPVGGAFLLIAAFYYLVSTLLSLAAPVSPWITLVLFLLLFVPLVTGSRMVFAAAVQGTGKR